MSGFDPMEGAPDSAGGPSQKSRRYRARQGFEMDVDGSFFRGLSNQIDY
jgi:hypothetical protein